MTTLNSEKFADRAQRSANELSMAFLSAYGYAEPREGLSGRYITRRRSGAPPPLSFAQQQVWLHAQLAPGIPLYNEILILERTGPLNREVLERSFREITRRHETLRTTFLAVDGTPIQVIAQYQALELPLTNLSGLMDQQRTAEVLRIATEEARQPFNLAEGPLMRARVLRLSQENYVLVVTLHTIIADKW